MTQALLTFDDGPDPVWTPAILDALGPCHAAFFVLADRACAHPEIVEECLRRGHPVELHAVQHVRHTELTADEIEDEAARGLAILRDLGARPTRWRPPWGVTSPLTWPVAARHDLLVTGWTHDSEDWRGEDADIVQRRVADAGHGDIVLLHDGIGPGAQRTDCSATVKVVQRLRAGPVLVR